MQNRLFFLGIACRVKQRMRKRGRRKLGCNDETEAELMIIEETFNSATHHLAS